MAWQIAFATDDGEKVVSLDDLSPEVFEQIAKDTNSGLTYWGVYQFPKESPEILYRVICAAAELAGIEPPGRAETMKAMNEQSAMFSPATDIGDQAMQDGFPQEPGGPESGSSSGVPGDSDGTGSSVSDSQ